MISYIEGEVLLLESLMAVVKINGLGYQLALSKTDSDKLIIGEVVNLFVHTHVREDALELYGFLNLADKKLFLLLISISGVGPKLALAILTALPANNLIHAIANRDIVTLSKISGIGKKTAERLILELKEKAIKVSTDVFNNNQTRENLAQAIRNLGYSKTQTDGAMMSIDKKDFLSLPLEDLIKKALIVLSGSNPS